MSEERRLAEAVQRILVASGILGVSVATNIDTRLQLSAIVVALEEHTGMAAPTGHFAPEAATHTPRTARPASPAVKMAAAPAVSAAGVADGAGKGPMEAAVINSLGEPIARDDKKAPADQVGADAKKGGCCVMS